MAKVDKKIRRPAGLHDEYALNIMNIATEPNRKKSKAEKGPAISRENVSSIELSEGISIKAFDGSKSEKDRN